MIHALIRLLLFFFEPLLKAAKALFAARGDIAGVRFWYLDDQEGHVLARALCIIEQVDPECLDRVRRSIRRVEGTMLGSYYLPKSQTAHIRWLSGSASAAMAIVHEAKHAELHRAGAPYSGREAERQCVLEQVRFARMALASGRVASLEDRRCFEVYAALDVEAVLATRWWQPEERARRLIDVADDLVVRGQLPGWMGGFVRALLRVEGGRIAGATAEPPSSSWGSR